MDIGFSKISGRSVAQDIMDKVSAYKAQYAYDPLSLSGLNPSSAVNSFSGITSSWIQGIANPAGRTPYAPGGSTNTGLVPININSSISDMMKAYPHLKSTLLSFPANYILRSDPDIYYKNAQ